MKAVIQRVSKSELSIDGEMYSYVDGGLLVLLGVEKGDEDEDIRVLSEKLVGLRIFEDNQGKMNNSVLQEDGEIMIVSNFTLCADCRKGRRPSFENSEEPKKAKLMYEAFVKAVKDLGVKKVTTGVFGADMKINLLNDGPVTIILDSNKLNKKR